MFDDSHCVLDILTTNRINLNIHHDHSPLWSTKLSQYYYTLTTICIPNIGKQMMSNHTKQ